MLSLRTKDYYSLICIKYYSIFVKGCLHIFFWSKINQLGSCKHVQICRQILVVYIVLSIYINETNLIKI